MIAEFIIGFIVFCGLAYTLFFGQPPHVRLLISIIITVMIIGAKFAPIPQFFTSIYQMGGTLVGIWVGALSAPRPRSGEYPAAAAAAACPPCPKCDGH